MSLWSYTRPGGFEDHDPRASQRRIEVEATILDVFRSRGFDRVMVPVLEYADLYDRRRIGEDLYHQLMVSHIAESRQFPAHDSTAEGLAAVQEIDATHEVVLRPDFTAPVARAVVSGVLEHGLPLRLPVRVSYAGDVFRNVVPRFGALKAVRQVGVEWVGLGGLPIDLEALVLACDVADALGIRDWFLSLGHAALCPALTEALGVTEPRVRDAVVAGLRRYHRYAQRLRAQGEARQQEARRFFSEVFSGLASGSNPDDSVAFTTDRSRLLDSFARSLERIWQDAHGIDPALSRRLIGLVNLDPAPEAYLHDVARAVPVNERLSQILDEVRALVERLQAMRTVRVEISPVSGRPIGYYTGVTFELYGRADTGALTRFCGGGRYDQLYRWVHERALATGKLASVTSSHPIPDHVLRGVGFAFGIDRVLEVSRVPSVWTGEIRISAVEPDLDLLALEIADDVRRRLSARVVWYPAASETSARTDSDAWTGVAVVPLEVTVARGDNDTLVVTELGTGRSWTGTRNQVAAAFAEAVLNNGSEAGTEGKR